MLLSEANKGQKVGTHHTVDWRVFFKDFIESKRGKEKNALDYEKLALWDGVGYLKNYRHRRMESKKFAVGSVNVPSPLIFSRKTSLAPYACNVCNVEIPRWDIPAYTCNERLMEEASQSHWNKIFQPLSTLKWCSSTPMVFSLARIMSAATINKTGVNRPVDQNVELNPYNPTADNRGL